MPDFDVVVIGSGAGGAVAAWVFAQAGRKVLLIERGQPVDSDPRDLLRNHRFARYGHNTGPDQTGNPRTYESADGSRQILGPLDPGYNNNAVALGGGTVVYGAQAWRFHPLDFRMASTYGVPEGSSLADWPIDYHELEPYYAQIEHLLGVSGDDGPLPAMPLYERGHRIAAAADELGWAHRRVPLMINSEPYAGRPACLECGMCVGFLCPNHARADTRHTLIAWAEATGNLEIWTGAFVSRITTSAAGRATGVQTADGREVSAVTIVVAAGAIESARLLLMSANLHEPNGIGNTFDHVGRHLQGHYYPGAFGLFADEINDQRGPGPTVSVTEFNHGNPGIVGGGMLADDFHVIPSVFAGDFRPPGVPAYGHELKDYVRHAYRRCFRLQGPVQDIPSPTSRVRLDPDVRDANGLPVARLSGTAHPETVRTATFMQARAEEWMRASGAEHVWSHPVGLWLSAGQHQAGTCRMSAHPETGVVDARGHVHGHDNLLVCDTSVHVTNGGFNPFLTAMACALRTASLAVADGL